MSNADERSLISRSSALDRSRNRWRRRSIRTGRARLGETGAASPSPPSTSWATVLPVRDDWASTLATTPQVQLVPGATYALSSTVERPGAIVGNGSTVTVAGDTVTRICHHREAGRHDQRPAARRPSAGPHQHTPGIRARRHPDHPQHQHSSQQLRLLLLAELVGSSPVPLPTITSTTAANSPAAPSTTASSAFRSPTAESTASLPATASPTTGSPSGTRPATGGRSPATAACSARPPTTRSRSQAPTEN